MADRDGSVFSLLASRPFMTEKSKFSNVFGIFQREPAHFQQCVDGSVHFLLLQMLKNHTYCLNLFLGEILFLRQFGKLNGREIQPQDSAAGSLLPQKQNHSSQSTSLSKLNFSKERIGSGSGIREVSVLTGMVGDSAELGRILVGTIAVPFAPGHIMSGQQLLQVGGIDVDHVILPHDTGSR